MFRAKTGMAYFVDLHLEVDGRITVSEGHKIAHNFKDFVLNRMPDISDILIHIEPKKSVNFLKSRQL